MESKGRGRVSDSVRNRGYTDEQIAEIEKKLTKSFQPITSCGIRFTKPFGHLRYSHLSYCLMLFENYQKGILPFEGSVADQPAQIMEIFSVLAELRREQEEKQNEKIKKNGRNQHKNQPRTRR
jgi:hypothetical protein